MVKLLRKRRKWFIAIFGSFLMVTFLLSGPQSIFQPNPLKAEEGRLGGQKVTVEQVMDATNELDILSDLAPGVMQGLGVEDSLHWFLLASEARQQGLVGNPADGRDYLPELARAQVPAVVRARTIQSLRDGSAPFWQFLQRNPEQLNAFLDQQFSRMSASERASVASEVLASLEARREGLVGRQSRARGPQAHSSQVDSALANLRGVMRLIRAYQTAPRLSDRRFLHTARKSADRVLADVLVIPASLSIDQAWTPSEQEIVAHFEALKNAEPETGDTGQGYRQPQRVQMEWITLDRAVIANAVTLDLKEVSKHYQQHRDQFPGSFDAERANVEQVLRDRIVDDVLVEADRIYKNRVRSELRDLPTREGRRVLPADWASRRPTMQSLAQAMAEGVRTASRVSIAVPDVQVRSGWVRVDRLNAEAGIGGAELASGTRVVPFPELVMSVQELNPASRASVQVGVPIDSALIDMAGNRYYLVITAARGASAPDSLDEVREQVVRDLRELRAFEVLSQRESEFLALASTDGLGALAAQIAGGLPVGTPAPRVVYQAAFTSDLASQQVPLLGGKSLRDRIMTVGQALGAMTPATDDNRALRTVVVPLRQDRAVVVAQVVGMQPITRELLAGVNQVVAERFATAELMDEGADQTSADTWAFSMQALTKRLDWKPARAPRGTATQEPAATPAAPSTNTTPPANPS